ncbi:MAG: amidohydrolase family protein [Phyllobacteriaceae bacterium]|jgi:predicted TIM-barrel fold metal-dependent hydrolase|nr:amidohydrolase family protein [Phyllobacteriaceae bacterium]
MKPHAEMPVAVPQSPDWPLPPGACDAHIHMVAAPGEFALWEGRVEDPAPGLDFEGWVALYEQHMQALGLERVVIVHSIFYGADNSVTAAAVARLGRGRARGIGLVTDAATDADLDALAEAGLCGVRLNYVHGGVLSWAGVTAMADRLKARGLHVQMLMNAHKHMAELDDGVRAMPVDVVFDHVGWPDVAAGPEEPGFKRLLGLLADGKAWVKLSGLYRLTGAPYEATDALVAALIDANPERCLWGSDWPHLMLADAQMPDAGDLLNAFLRVVTDEATRHRILVDNPARLYGF